VIRVVRDGPRERPASRRVELGLLGAVRVLGVLETFELEEDLLAALLSLVGLVGVEAEPLEDARLLEEVARLDGLALGAPREAEARGREGALLVGVARRLEALDGLVPLLGEDRRVAEERLHGRHLEVGAVVGAGALLDPRPLSERRLGGEEVLL